MIFNLLSHRRSNSKSSQNQVFLKKKNSVRNPKDKIGQKSLKRHAKNQFTPQKRRFKKIKRRKEVIGCEWVQPSASVSKTQRLQHPSTWPKTQCCDTENTTPHRWFSKYKTNNLKLVGSIFLNCDSRSNSLNNFCHRDCDRLVAR